MEITFPKISDEVLEALVALKSESRTIEDVIRDTVRDRVDEAIERALRAGSHAARAELQKLGVPAGEVSIAVSIRDTDTVRKDFTNAIIRRKFEELFA